MALTATLHGHCRSAERQPFDADATLRFDNRPMDVLIANISASGCLFVCAEGLAVGDVVTIGIAGVERRRMKIVRSLGSRYGAEFEFPMAQAEIDAALIMPNQTVVSFPVPIAGSLNQGATTLKDEKFASQSRFIIIAVLVLASWCTLIACVHLIR